MEEPQPSQDPSLEPSLISEELRNQLLILIADRMNTGQVMIAEAHFLKAMVEGYQALSGNFPSQEIKKQLGKIIAEVNKENPETFVIPGIENWITQSVAGIVQKKKWGITELQEQGQGLIRDFVRQDKVRNLIAQLGLTANQLNIRNSMRAITNRVAGKQDPEQKRSAARLAQVMATLKSQESQTAGPAALNRLLAGPASEPDEQEVASRTQEQKKVQARLRQGQMEHLIQNLDTYVKEGKIEAEDAERLRNLKKVEDGVKKGKMTAENGSKIRNSILSGTARDRLERKVRDEVDYVVVYRQMFEALQRIDPKYDDGLRFLIGHKEVVNVETREEVDWKETTEALIENLEALNQLIGMMDRQDAEVRMIAARLPPYSHVVRRGQDRVENLVIEESFVEDLRQKQGEEITAMLNDPDKKVRALLAAAMLSLNALINRLIKSTPFRKEIRILKINLIVEEFFRSTENVEEAREKAQEFLRSRLHSLFPDLNPEETQELQQRGAEMIEAVEQKVLAERKAAGGGEKTVVSTEGSDDGLSEKEVEQGVQLGRVAMRTPAGVRLRPYKIMPDQEEPGKFILARRDPESGETVPVLRGGRKRQVTRNREGVWELD